MLRDFHHGLLGHALLCALILMGATPPGHLGLFANAQPPGPGDVIDRVLAMVEGQVILLSDVRAFLDLRLIEPPDAADPTPVVLTALIERELILSEVRPFVDEAPPAAEVDALLEAVMRRVGGPEAFQERLPVVGFTVEDVRQELRDDLLIERYLIRRWGSARQPTEGEVVAYFRDHADAFLVDGVLPSFDAARDDARRRASEEMRQMRQALIDAWVASLTARADVRVTP